MISYDKLFLPAAAAANQRQWTAIEPAFVRVRV
jgi:hypothetical protein